MTLRSKSMGVLALFAVFTLIFLSGGCGEAFAQGETGKSNAPGPSAFKPLVTFVEIGAAKCIPCKAMQPIMKAVEEEYKGQVRVVFHDVWTTKGREDAEKYNIRMIPTQVFLDKEGREYFRHEGYFPKVDVVRVLIRQGVK